MDWFLKVVAAACVVIAAQACTGPTAEVQSNRAEAVAVSVASLNTATAVRPAGWDEYWYSGKAELNTYKTTQNRYGENREGTAVLIFVTEPFLPVAQVKDDGVGGKEASISVLKLNRIERFETGIYDYSIMQSVFTPVSRNEYPHTLKTTTSVQDWCGQAWTQYNFRKGSYQVEHRSYFQKEGDQNTTYAAAVLEDELLNVVRLDPNLLPSGKTMVIPSEKYGRLFHVDTAPQAATVSFSESGTERVLRVDYPASKRTLEYRFEGAFPNRLLSWTETVDKQQMMSAVRMSTRQEPYWIQNRNSFSPMRDSLGL